jgi:AraC-like DNA-binding protein
MDILLRRASTDEPFRAQIVGTMTTALVVEEGHGTECLGVRFRPGEAFRFLRVPASEATNEIVPLDAAWGSIVRELEDRVTEAPDEVSRIRAIDAFLIDQAKSAAPGDFRIRRAIRSAMLEGATPRDPNIGSRQLRRIFDTFVGISPKALSRVLRMKRAVAMMDGQWPGSWAALASLCGYCDQSHLVREFQTLVGLSPAQFAKTRVMSVSSNPRSQSPAID